MRLYLRSPFIFTHHLLQSALHWMGKKRRRGLDQMSSHHRLHALGVRERLLPPKNKNKKQNQLEFFFVLFCFLLIQEVIIRVVSPKSTLTEDARTCEERQVLEQPISFDSYSSLKICLWRISDFQEAINVYRDVKWS